VKHKTISEICREVHIQDCSHCEDFNCGDNLRNPFRGSQLVNDEMKCTRYPPHHICQTMRAHLAGDSGAHGCDTCAEEIRAILERTSEITSKRRLLEKEAK
jgi:hypothetical protein